VKQIKRSYIIRQPSHLSFSITLAPIISQNVLTLASACLVASKSSSIIHMKVIGGGQNN